MENSSDSLNTSSHGRPETQNLEQDESMMEQRSHAFAAQQQAQAATELPEESNGEEHQSQSQDAASSNTEPVANTTTAAATSSSNKSSPESGKSEAVDSTGTSFYSAKGEHDDDANENDSDKSDVQDQGDGNAGFSPNTGTSFYSAIGEHDNDDDNDEHDEHDEEYAPPFPRRSIVEHVSSDDMEDVHFTSSDKSSSGDDFTSDDSEGDAQQKGGGTLSRGDNEEEEGEKGQGNQGDQARVETLLSGTWESPEKTGFDQPQEQHQNKHQQELEVFADEDDMGLAREQPDPAVYKDLSYRREQGLLILSVDHLQFYPYDNDRQYAPTLELLWFNIAKHEISPKSFAVPMLRIKDVAGNNFIFQLPNAEVAEKLRSDLKDYPTVNDSPKSQEGDDDDDDSGEKTRPESEDKPKASNTSDPTLALPPTRLFPGNSRDVEDPQDINDALEQERTPLMAPHPPQLPRDQTDLSSSGEDWDDEGQTDDEWEEGSKAKQRANKHANEEMDAGADTRGAEADYALALADKEQQDKREREQSKRIYGLFCLVCCMSGLLLLLAGGVAGYFIGRVSEDSTVRSANGAYTEPSSPNVPVSPIMTASPQPTTLSPTISSPQPTVAPSTTQPSSLPTATPSTLPSMLPSRTPSLRPSFQPSAFPSLQPTIQIATLLPTKRGIPPPKTPEPTTLPVLTPTALPSLGNTLEPTPTQLLVGDTPEPTTPPLLTPTTLPSLGNTLEPTPTLLLVDDTMEPTIAFVIDDELTEPPDGTAQPTETAPSQQPTISERPLLEILTEASFDSGTALRTQGTPQQQAYFWMALQEQPEGLSEYKKIQRYALATFYYSTGGPQAWTIMRRSMQQSISKWMDNTIDDCEWEFVVCDASGGILALEMMFPTMPSLVGILPPEIGMLTTMTQFVISGDPVESSVERNVQQSWQTQNETEETLGVQLREDFQPNATSPLIGGPIPSELGALTGLETFVIANQGLIGTIPTELAGMQSLRIFDLSSNSLGGTLPMELKDLSRVVELRLGMNLLAGELDPSLFSGGLARSLSGLYLYDNNLRGELPTELGLLLELTALYLNQNDFIGQLPTELAKLTNIEYFRVDGNAELTGEIPVSFWGWTAIEEFGIDGTNITGKMPKEVCATFTEQTTDAFIDCELFECTCCNYCCVDGTCSLEVDNAV